MSANEIYLEKINSIEMKISYKEVGEVEPLKHREMHLHDEYELYIPYKGGDAFELNGRLCAIPDNSLVIIRPYELHRCVFGNKEQHQYFWILIKGDDILFESFFRPEEKSSIISMSKENFDELFFCLVSMLENKKGFEQYSYFFKVMDIIKKGEIAELSEERATLPPDVVRALEYMDRNMEKKFDIRTVAKESMVSINTLERHFMEYLQLSPSQAIRRKRLLNAANLLRQGYSVSESCEKSGFIDYSNFIATFRKVYGMTPLKYQKNAKK